ncbi:sulfite exporter TauE/SafE family protein [Cryobacterium melibiosiphilum]|uniref:Probable membrane transporter protein n=1 Tax=Cryobacterium melibiosiphilum TaxID=995039 RepID=A0A3A5MC70_9MICO|nr:sulfite exporter TauE/SafE family protein [Cryobacterium melibiosiphilum]RJT85174.1 sulfite exporter TauE/SafE family protein [Cryobacterium melibiosiphilum]
MTGLEIAIIAVAIVAASALQASIGFGMGMLAAPVIGLIDPTLLPGTVIMLAVLLTAAVALKERSHLDLRGAGWALVGRIPGSLIGAWLVFVLPASGLAWAVAVVVLGGVVMALSGWAPVPNRVSLITAGAASGVMGTATSIGGAPMALIWQRSRGPQLRGTMSAFFLVGSSISLIALAALGTVTPATLQLAAWMVPAVLVGYVLSRFVNRFLNHRRLRMTALAASALGAVLLIGAQLL